MGLNDIVEGGISMYGYIFQRGCVYKSMSLISHFKSGLQLSSKDSVCFPVDLLALVASILPFVSKMSPKKLAFFCCEEKLASHSTVVAAFGSGRKRCKCICLLRHFMVL